MSKFTGKTAVISGCAEGIGLSIAKALGEQKMNIVLTDINEENLQKTLKVKHDVKATRSTCKVQY